MDVLWGPLYFVFDRAPENRLTGWVLLLLCAALFLLSVVKPRGWTLLLAAFGLLLWLASGILGCGINV